MPDEIVIKPKSESEAASTGSAQQNQNLNLSRAQLINICALGLGISFFLPWAQIFGNNISGFDLQKLGDQQLLLWAIPIFSAITILAGLIKQGQHIVGQVAGVLPFFVGVFWYLKLGNDMFRILSFGAYLSLIFGLGLCILSQKSK